MSDHLFDCRETLDEALSHFVAKQLSEAIAERGEATLVVSGGSTPRGFFKLLASQELPWQDVTVLAADDRWVPLTDNASNETMIRQTLLQGLAARASLLSLVSEYPDAAASLSAAGMALEQMPTFDVVILGMGLDGHTASLFPCSAQLEEGLSTSAPVLMTAPTTAPHQRVTLSRARLADTRVGLVHIVGDDKKAVFNEAAAHGDTHRAPIAAFLGGDKPFSLWHAP